MNDNIILTEVYNTYKINIITDINPVDPREFDNFGKMQCFHRDYRLGDTLDFNTIEELIYFIKNPDIISRGFIYLRENQELIDEIRKRIRGIMGPLSLYTSVLFGC